MRELLRDAFGGETPLPWPSTRRAVGAGIAACALLFAWLSLRRYATYHNVTFDLAFYARMAWGEVHHDVWNPIVDAHVRGLHLSWVLVPLGWIGALVGTPETLLVAQALALAGAAWPLARVGARHLGAPGALVTAAAWLLHPNVSAVATSEFHPGSVAVLPLAWALDALDRRSAAGLALGVLGTLACREDLGLVTALLGLAAVWLARPGAERPAAGPLRRTGGVLAAGSLGYALFFALVLLPRYAPQHGSLELHFGRLGGDPASVVVHLLTHPRALFEHLAVPHRAFYLPLIAAPFAWLPFVRPFAALLATPVLAINLVSEFPGTTDLDSHYLTPALPALLVASVHGMAALPARPQIRFGVPMACAVLAHVLGGTTPLSLAFPRAAFTADDDSRAAARLVAQIPPDASVQAPDALLPHLAERRVVHRAPPPEANTAFVVFDAVHRRTFLHDESMLRTTEEPILRAWLARPDHVLLDAGGDYYLLQRGGEPRSGIGARFLVGRTDPDRGVPLTGCLSLLGGRVVEARADALDIDLELVAQGPCPDDLALRIGRGKRPRHVDLIARGWLSPAHFERGDVIRSSHTIARAAADGLRIGALRSSGARPDRGDPMSVELVLER